MMPASYKLRFHWRKNLVPFQNDLTVVTAASDGSLGQAIDIVDAVAASTFLTNLLACVPTDVTLEAVACQSVVMNGGSATPSATAVNVVATPGTRAPSMGTGQTSNQSGPIVTYFPDVVTGERSRACKVFVPTVNESDGEDDVISGGLLGALDTAFLSLVAGIAITGGTATWAAAIKLAGVPTVRAITGWITRTYIASQRRRRPAAHT